MAFGKRAFSNPAGRRAGTQEANGEYQMFSPKQGGLKRGSLFGNQLSNRNLQVVLAPKLEQIKLYDRNEDTNDEKAGYAAWIKNKRKIYKKIF